MFGVVDFVLLCYSRYRRHRIIFFAHLGTSRDLMPVAPQGTFGCGTAKPLAVVPQGAFGSGTARHRWIWHREAPSAPASKKIEPVFHVVRYQQKSLVLVHKTYPETLTKSPKQLDTPQKIRHD